jgi:folylpolyglutamate synthase/dihydropteroate synthase
MSIDELKDLASRFPRVNVAKDIAAACDEAYENMDTKSVLCIVGSHYIAEEVYAWKSRRMEG